MGGLTVLECEKPTDKEFFFLSTIKFRRKIGDILKMVRS
ncbi:hypothetical protein CHITON_1568 [Thermococcus chitonophagus]|uniref:Uncharacterized protein n=1 Tax=Thermococcus chitonophagus TaxID=54262 RepID=A0A160VTA0_9EURY|nr:hypothetical protein CHITON_1568 [Thermococcus chitonophagus]